MLYVCCLNVVSLSMHLYIASAQYSHGCSVQWFLGVVAWYAAVVSSCTVSRNVLAGNAATHASRFV